MSSQALAPVGSMALTRGEDLMFAIEQRPDFAIVRVQLESGQKVLAEPSVMMSMSPSILLQAGFKGGFGRTIGRALGGESMIVSTFTAREPGEVVFAAGALGDISHYRIRGNELYLQRGAFVASSPGVQITGKWQGARGFFSGEGLVLLKASGHGDLFFNSFGAILEIDVAGEYYVDTGFIVAFEDTLGYQVTTLPGLSTRGKVKSFFFGGEGLVTRFSGQGRLWVQTRAVNPFLNWVTPYRPVERRSS
ncbi:MAG: TIGR00266 family protein [Deltaproteobacteria bacterium]|nr:TIGR00266 family protein [Deltaproteobacteria bacterium]